MNIRIWNERALLVLALERQDRARSTEEWLADQIAINNALDQLALAGCDRAHEAAEADKRVARWIEKT